MKELKTIVDSNNEKTIEEWQKEFSEYEKIVRLSHYKCVSELICANIIDLFYDYSIARHHKITLLKKMKDDFNVYNYD
jgi:hypothetical protein